MNNVAEYTLHRGPQPCVTEVVLENGEGADVEGYRIRQDRVEPMPTGAAGGGGYDRFLGQMALGALGIVGIGLAGPNI